MDIFPRTPHWNILTYEQKLRMLMVYARKQYIHSRRKWYWFDARKWKGQWRTYLDSMKHYKASVDKCDHAWYVPARPTARRKICLAERPERY